MGAGCHRQTLACYVLIVVGIKDCQQEVPERWIYLFWTAENTYFDFSSRGTAIPIVVFLKLHAHHLYQMFHQALILFY